MDLSGKTVLLTGGSGFIGKNLIERLNSSGAKVINIGRGNISGIENISVDLTKTDFSFLKSLNPDYFVHLAAFSSPSRSKIKEDVYALNVEATRSLLTNLQNKGLKKAILFSSVVVYGSSEEHLSESSQTCENPGIYAQSKLRVEDISKSFIKTGLPIITFRLSNTYGPHQQWRKEEIPTLIPQLISQAITENRICVWDVTPIRDYIFVDDVCDAIISSFDSGYNGILNLGSGIGTPVGKIASLISEISNAQIEYLNRPSSGPKKIVLEISKVSKQLNWSPKTLLEEGISKTYSYYKENIK